MVQAGATAMRFHRMGESRRARAGIMTLGRPGVLRAALVLSMALLPNTAFAGETVLVPAGAVWRYLDDGSDQGDGWRQPDFDAGAWCSGPAQLGYGDGDEATVVSSGPDVEARHITTYFRHSFDVPDTAGVKGVRLRVLRDDGAVVYLGGDEVFRTNMPDGPIDHLTVALQDVDRASESLFVDAFLDPSLLLTGTNVLAVEVHQRSSGSPDMGFDLEVVLTTRDAFVTRGPYLQRPTATSVVVRWRTSTPTDSEVRYGTSQHNLSLSASDGVLVTEHEVLVDGLIPDTLYYYSVGTSTELLAGDDADHFFVTAPRTGVAGPTRIWVVGDSGTADGNAAAVRDAYLSFAGGRRTDVWLMLGDNAYGSGTDGQYQAALFDMFGDSLRHNALWPTLGNHDGISSDSLTQSGPFYDIFTLPQSGEAGGLPSGTEAYYSFDHGNVHFICLNSYGTSRMPGGAMMTWLERDLSETMADWIIAYWHHPPYSKGGHDSDHEGALVEMREIALPILEAGGVDLVLNGHSHSYERSFLLDGHYGTSRTLTPGMFFDVGDGREDGQGAYVKPSGGPHPRTGTVYVVAGSSSRLGGGALNHPAMHTSISELGCVVIDIDGPRLDTKFLEVDGTVTDHFTILKGIENDPGVLCPRGISCIARLDGVFISWRNHPAQEPESISVTRDGTPLPGSPFPGDTTMVVDPAGSDGRHTYLVKAAFGAPFDTLDCPALECVSDSEITLANIGGSWRFLRGVEEPTSDQDGNPTLEWTEIDFDDSRWEIGATGIGYGDGDDATILEDMRNNYVSVYLRYAFEVSDAAAFRDLRLGVDYDDGFVAYLNGVEIARAGLDSLLATPRFDATALDHEAGRFEHFAVSEGILRSGDNVLAVQVHNQDPDSSDLSMIPELSGSCILPVADCLQLSDSTVLCPTGLSCSTGIGGVTISWKSSASGDPASISVTRDGTPLPGSPFPGDTISVLDPDGTRRPHFYSVKATFSSPFDALDCPALGCISGAVSTLVEVGDDWRFFSGTEEPTPDQDGNPTLDWTRIGFDDSTWKIGATGIGYGDGDDVTILGDMRDNYVSVYLRYAFEVAETAAFRALRLNVDYDDGFVAYLNGVEIARAGLDPLLAPPHFRATALEHEAGDFEEFAVTEGALEDGANVLAIQVHNNWLASSDLSMTPELIGESNLCPTHLACSLSEDGRSVTLDWNNVIAYESIAIVRDGEMIQSIEGDRESYTDHDVLCGTEIYQLVPRVLGMAPCAASPECRIRERLPAEERQFVRADVSGDGAVNISDPVMLLGYLFGGEGPPACRKSADADDDGTINITDAVSVLNFLFAGGPPPAAPFPLCCTDPTEDTLGCESVPACP